MDGLSLDDLEVLSEIGEEIEKLENMRTEAIIKALVATAGGRF